MSVARSNRRTALGIAGAALGMGGLSFAAVPLYRLFCQVTGYGGTTGRAEQAPEAASDRWLTVRFDATTANDLPWRFEPVERSVRVRVGEERIAFYRATNLARGAVAGTATFNVTPFKAGPHFRKLACFCFGEQVLEPGQSVEMPVSFFVDPSILADRNADEIATITLSYTFFRARTAPQPGVAQAGG